MAKEFLCKDLSGGGRTPQTLDDEHILKLWDVDEVDGFGTTLAEWIRESEIGDEWYTDDAMVLIRIK